MVVRQRLVPAHPVRKPNSSCSISSARPEPPSKVTSPTPPTSTTFSTNPTIGLLPQMARNAPDGPHIDSFWTHVSIEWSACYSVCRTTPLCQIRDVKYAMSSTRKDARKQDSEALSMAYDKISGATPHQRPGDGRNQDGSLCLKKRTRTSHPRLTCRPCTHH